MKNSLKAAALQLPLVWGDKKGALALVEQQLSQLSGVELFLLPEAMISGYLSPRADFDLRPFAEPLLGETYTALSSLAARFKVGLAAPLIEKAGDQFYNSLLFFDESGALCGHWRKRHPWFPERWASPGNLGTPVISWRGISICAGICFDLHFMAKEASEELKRADLFLFPSVWVEEKGDTRTPQLQALAKKFQVRVINANWARSIPKIQSQGGSVIINPKGEIIARAKDDSSQAVTATLEC